MDLSLSPLHSTQVSLESPETRTATAISVRCDQGWDVHPNSESLTSDVYTFWQTNQAAISHAYLQPEEAIYLVVLELPRRGRHWFLSLEKFCRYWGADRHPLGEVRKQEVWGGSWSEPLSLAKLQILLGTQISLSFCVSGSCPRGLPCLLRGKGSELLTGKAELWFPCPRSFLIGS